MRDDLYTSNERLDRSAQPTNWPAQTLLSWLLVYPVHLIWLYAACARMLEKRLGSGKIPQKSCSNWCWPACLTEVCLILEHWFFFGNWGGMDVWESKLNWRYYFVNFTWGKRLKIRNVNDTNIQQWISSHYVLFRRRLFSLSNSICPQGHLPVFPNNSISKEPQDPSTSNKFFYELNWDSFVTPRHFFAYTYLQFECI